MIWSVLFYVLLFVVGLIIVFTWIDEGNRWSTDYKFGVTFGVPALGGAFLLLATGILYASGLASSEFTKAEETVYTVVDGSEVDTTGSYIEAIVLIDGKPEAIDISANTTTVVPGDKKEIKVERYERNNPVTLPWRMNDETFVTITLGK